MTGMTARVRCFLPLQEVGHVLGRGGRFMKEAPWPVLRRKTFRQKGSFQMSAGDSMKDPGKPMRLELISGRSFECTDLHVQISFWTMLPEIS